MTYTIQTLLLYTEVKMSWTEAQSYCREWHDDLATISDLEVNNAIANMAKDFESPFWIGLYDDIHSWRWSLVGQHFYTGVAQHYRQWQENQPDNTGSAEHCVSMMDDGFWRDNNCMAIKMPLICLRGELHQAEL